MLSSDFLQGSVIDQQTRSTVDVVVRPHVDYVVKTTVGLVVRSKKAGDGQMSQRRPNELAK
jgi:hypothetical protein